MQETWVRSLGREDPLEEGMAIHSSILAWRVSQTEEPGGLRSMGSKSQTGLTDYYTQSYRGESISLVTVIDKKRFNVIDKRMKSLPLCILLQNV